MSGSRTAVRSAAVAAALALTGCFSYVPVDRPDPGTPVRVHLPVTSRVAGLAAGDRTETLSLEGTVVALGDSLSLETQTEQFGGGRIGTFIDTVTVAYGSLNGVEERVFSRGRTLALTAGVLAALGAVLLAIAEAGGGDEGGGGEPPPPTTSAVIPLKAGGTGGALKFSIPVP